MLCISRMLGSRQSLWPAKFIALSVATCPVNALAQVYRLSLSWTVPSSESFSHTSPVFTSATVPSPWSAYASGAPPRSSPSSPVPAHEMAFPLLSQHVVCPVAGSGQHHPLRGPRSRTRLTRNDASVLMFEAGGERRLPDAGRTSSETRTWRRRDVRSEE